MIDINLLRTNPELVKENIKKKFQDHKLELVDKAIVLDTELRDAKRKGDDLRAMKNKLSKEIGALMAKGEKAQAEENKQKVKDASAELARLEELEATTSEELKKIMMILPNIIDPTVPIGKDDSENVEVEKFG
ncbi:MAG: serine--tRNA ligase, partial [Erysipelotrichales bacterium]|nr:serine--tRNA ligase [Erysipelotrichales bacterium]